MNKPCVLIVDPSRTARAVIRSEFRPDSFEIIESADGDDAINKSLKACPAIITLNMVLPPTNGLTVCKELGLHDCLAHTSVIMVTGSDTPQERSLAFEAGAIRFLSKGFHQGELTVQIEEVMQQRGSLADTCILTVDDSAFVRGSVSRVLGKERATVLTADDGSTALLLLDQEPVDLIITDYHMPIVDGISLVKAVRRHDSHANTPILFLTGSEDRAALVRALDAGATDFVRKPFDATELLARVRSLSRLSTALKRLTAQASTDELTGALNRREAMAVCSDLCASAQRYDTPFSCLMIDIDHFKTINDTFGHAGGDFVLVEFVNILRSNLRQMDKVCRIGGEEFLLLLPQVEQENAVACAEKLRRQVETHSFVFDKHPIAVTMTVGVAQHHRGLPDADALLRVADTALYQGKQAGRNRVSVAGDRVVAPTY